MRYPTVLTIAGSDSCGGAGIQADIKTMSAIGVYGCSAITAITSQNTTGVRSIQGINPEILQDQINAVFEDFVIDSIKSGMLFSKESVKAIAICLQKHKPKHFVLDPVMVSTSGSKLISDEAIETVKELLFSQTTLITPNTEEVRVLTNISINSLNDTKKAAEKLLLMGCNAVLIKGGHMKGENAADILFQKDKKPLSFSSEYVQTQNTHGTGCTLSAAIASYLALGNNLEDACKKSKAFISDAIKAGKDIEAGHGHGPVNHFFNPQKLTIL